MQTYFKDVGGSQILNTTTQYPGNNGTPSDTSTYVDSVVDTTAFPHTGADVADAVTQGDINTEVFNHINAQRLAATGSATCTSCSCRTTSSTATTRWRELQHERILRLPHVRLEERVGDTPANDFIWADIPVNRGVYTTGGCGNSNVTGDNQADTTLSSVEHEHDGGDHRSARERLAGLDGRRGRERRQVQPQHGRRRTRSRPRPNNFLGSGFGDFFRIQREWSNAAALATSAGNGCAASYTTTGLVAWRRRSRTGGDVTEHRSPRRRSRATTATRSTTTSRSTTRRTRTTRSRSRRLTTYPRGVSGPRRPQPRRPCAAPDGDGNLHGDRDRRPAARRDGAHDDVRPSSFDDSTGTRRADDHERTATTTVVNAPPTLNLPGAQSQDYHDSADASGSRRATRLGRHR